MKKLLLDHKKRKRDIRKRLSDFSNIHKGSDKEIFEELCFCLFTPQSKAVSCDKAVKELKKRGFLFKGAKDDVTTGIGGVRFPNNKADFLLRAREVFKKGEKLKIKEKIDPADTLNTREWLVRNVKGIGYKEASHFLRNIGLGKDLAILDVHILRNLKRYGVIKDPPKTLTRKNYLDVEEKMKEFSRDIGIPMDELDLLFWSRETGVIFK